MNGRRSTAALTSTNTPEGALTVSRRSGEAAVANLSARCTERVKHGDHGVRLPRVAGREGWGLATPSASRAVERAAKEPLARPHHASNTLTARAITPRCRKSARALQEGA